MHIRNLVFAASVAALTVAPRAQWTPSPTSHVAVADGPRGQIAEHGVPTPDGGCYLSWYETPAGMPFGTVEYRVQRLDGGGREVWSHGGVAIPTGRARLGLHASGDALVVYTVDNAGTNDIFVTRLDADNGAEAWQPTGGTLVGNTSANQTFEFVTGLDDGDVVASWITNDRSQVVVQRLDENGAGRWQRTLTPPGTGIRTFAGSLAGAPNGDVIVTLGYFTGPLVSSPLWLRAQKFDATGATLWPAGQVPITLSGSVVEWHTDVDPNGGLVIAWSSGAEAALQRVDAAGNLAFAPDGVPVAANPASSRSEIGMTYDPASDDTTIAFRDQSSNNAVVLQRIDAAGNRQLGPDGTVLQNRGLGSIDSVHTAAVDGGVLTVWNTRVALGVDEVRGSIVDSAGALVAGPFAISSTPALKRVRAVMPSANGFAIVPFRDSSTGDDDVLAQNVLPDGTLGGPIAYAAVRNGSGVNPVVFGSKSAPAIGSDWKTEIAHAPADIATAILVHVRPDPGTLVPGFGELLVSFQFPTLIGRITVGTPSPDPYAISIPGNLNLVGLGLTSQGLVVAPSGAIQLTNALDVFIGL